MELITGIIIIWLSWITVMVGIEIEYLKSTVNKQQEQIDELMRKTSSQLNLIELVIDLNKAIATKVISIEERVDKYTKIVE